MKRKVECPSLELLFGTKDRNLAVIKDALNVEITVGADEKLEIAGSPKGVKRAQQIIGEFKKLVDSGTAVDESDLAAMIQAAANDPETSLLKLVGKTKTAGRVKQVHPLNPSQRAYDEAIDKHDMVFGIGVAGVGKSYVAVAKAVQALSAKQVERIVLVRPAVEAGEKLGFLPGTMKDKIDPYLRPLYDAVGEMVRAEDVERYLAKGVIEAAPVGFMRGRTLKNSFVIIDEAQNTTVEQMRMLLTRFGQGSKMVVNGDVTQVDLPKNMPSGMVYAQRVLQGVEGIYFHEFTEADVVRHPLVQRIVNAFKQDGEKK